MYSEAFSASISALFFRTSKAFGKILSASFDMSVLCIEFIANRLLSSLVRKIARSRQTAFDSDQEAGALQFI
jgi:hypothetical protein